MYVYIYYDCDMHVLTYRSELGYMHEQIHEHACSFAHAHMHHTLFECLFYVLDVKRVLKHPQTLDTHSNTPRL